MDAGSLDVTSLPTPAIMRSGHSASAADADKKNVRFEAGEGGDSPGGEKRTEGSGCTLLGIMFGAIAAVMFASLLCLPVPSLFCASAPSRQDDAGQHQGQLAALELNFGGERKRGGADAPGGKSIFTFLMLIVD